MEVGGGGVRRHFNRKLEKLVPSQHDLQTRITTAAPRLSETWARISPLSPSAHFFRPRHLGGLHLLELRHPVEHRRRGFHRSEGEVDDQLAAPDIGVMIGRAVVGVGVGRHGRVPSGDIVTTGVVVLWDVGWLLPRLGFCRQIYRCRYRRRRRPYTCVLLLVGDVIDFIVAPAVSGGEGGGGGGGDVVDVLNNVPTYTCYRVASHMPYIGATHGANRCKTNPVVSPSIQSSSTTESKS